MKVVCYAAVSINGLIADENGAEEWLSEEHWRAFEALLAEHGAFVMGRATYEAVHGWGEPYASDLGMATAFVLSRTPGGNRIATPEAALEAAGRAGFSSIVLAGGSRTYTAFFAKRLVDELVLSVEPSLLGDGVSFVAPFDGLVRAKPIGVELDEPSSIITLRYAFPERS